MHFSSPFLFAFCAAIPGANPSVTNSARILFYGQGRAREQYLIGTLMKLRNRVNHYLWVFLGDVNK